MITLEKLKGMGAIPGSLAEVSMAGVRRMEFADASVVAGSGGGVHGVVTVDRPVWLATLGGGPASMAATVYSCNVDGDVGCWKPERKTFLLMGLIDARLQTKQTLKFKEETKMANLGGLASEEMAAFDADLTNLDISPESLGGEAPAASAESMATEEKKGKKAELNEKQIQQKAFYDGIRSLSGNRQLVNADEAHINNHLLGRLICFITSTDNVIKLSSKSRPILDGNNRRVPDPMKIKDLDAEHRKKYEEKGYPTSVCKTEKYISFREVKPGKIIGVLIKTPAGSEVDMTMMHNGGVAEVDKKNKDMNYRLMSFELSMPYLSLNYDNWIQEDEKLLGAMASKILITATASESSVNEGTGVAKQKARIVYKVDKSDGKRNSLLTRGNFFPAKIYQTVDLSGMDAEKSEMLNLHFKALFDGKQDNVYENLCDESKSLIKYDPATGKVHSAYFNDGKKIEVKKFDARDNNDMVTDVRMPVREAIPTKVDPNKMRYLFKYDMVGEENGPQTVEQYRRIIDASGMSEEDFIKQVKKLSARKTGSKKAKIEFTSRDYLATLGTTVDSGVTGSLAEIQAEILGF